jgi:hypothetical protein
VTDNEAWRLSAAGMPPKSHGAALLSARGYTWVGTTGDSVIARRNREGAWSPFGSKLPSFGNIIVLIVLSLAVSQYDFLVGTAQGIYLLRDALSGLTGMPIQ